jgi:hypothetical protein
MASQNVILANNVFFSFVKFGINLDSGNNITIDGNVVIDVKERSFI